MHTYVHKKHYVTNVLLIYTQDIDERISNKMRRVEDFIRVVQMRRSEKFQCKECNRTFVHLEKAEKHVEIEHLDDNIVTVSRKPDRAMKRDIMKETEIVRETTSGREVRKKGTSGLDSEAETGKKSTHKSKRRSREVTSKKEENEQGLNPMERDTLTCNICSETFTEQYKLLEHEVEKHWICESCEVQFLHQQSWNDHKKECQGRQTPKRKSKSSETDQKELILCPNLQSYNRTEKFLRFVSVHLRSDSAKKRMSCTLCNAKYETLIELKKHIQGIHTHEKEYVCTKCGKGFVEKSKLLFHTLNTCSGINGPGNLSSGSDLEETAPLGTEESARSEDNVQQCQTVHPSEENDERNTKQVKRVGSEEIEMDEQRVHDDKEEETEVIFNITFDKELSQINSATGDEELDASLVEVETRMCTLCNIAFVYGFQRRQHMSTCHWGCFSCGVQFLHEEAYQSHLQNCNVAAHVQKGEYSEVKLRRSYESEDDFFKYVVIKYKEVDKKKQTRMECLICGKEYFGQMAKMMRHIKSVHTKQCDYICHSCSKPFADKDNFVKHMKKCTGKPWVPKSLESRTAPLSSVIETIHGDEDTTWACTQCSETFPEDYLFREHMSAKHWGCCSCLWQFLDEKAHEEHAKNCEDFKSPEDSDLNMPETDLIQYKNDRLFFKYVKMRILSHSSGRKTRTFECGHPHCQNSEHDHQTLLQLRRHIQSRHETKELKYHCTKCETGFVDKFSLWKHDSKCSGHGEKIVISKLLSRIKPVTNDGTDKEENIVVKRECPECEEGFLYDHNYREHMAMIHWGCKPCKLQFLSELAFEEHKEKCERPVVGRFQSLPKVNLKLYR